MVLRLRGIVGFVPIGKEKFPLMCRPFVNFVLFCFLGSSTGLLLAVHRHEVGPGHRADECLPCQLLTVQFSAVVDLPAPVFVDFGLCQFIPIVVVAAPVVRGDFDPAFPRAPPGVEILHS